MYNFSFMNLFHPASPNVSRDKLQHPIEGLSGRRSMNKWICSIYILLLTFLKWRVCRSLCSGFFKFCLVDANTNRQKLAYLKETHYTPFPQTNTIPCSVWHVHIWQPMFVPVLTLCSCPFIQVCVLHAVFPFISPQPRFWFVQFSFLVFAVI